MADDLPPPYTALTRHPMMPRTSHDEAARFNFLTHFNRYLSGTIGAGNKLAYDKRVLPAFQAEHGRDPEHRYEVRDAMNRDPWHRMWSALKRNSMEMRQHNGRQVVLRQLDELAARGLTRLVVPAALNAIGFYERLGYRAVERCAADIGGVRLAYQRMVKEAA